MRNLFCTFSIFLLAILFSDHAACQVATSGQKKIILIRHAEKPQEGNNLSCMGLNRALQLADVISNKFGKVNSILVPALNNGKSTNQARMFQTITPYAVKENMDINTKFNVTNIQDVARTLQNMTGSTLVVWEHNGIEKIVKTLGIAEKLKWDANDFDSIWIITWENGAPVLTKDAEHIKPGATCN